ncbi:hypothetical protein A2U01_0075119, partial [Trifolium medium]|nr:hypothetical protein [Trifolium medium]
NDQSSVVGLRKDWYSWPNKGHLRAKVEETMGIKAQPLCAATFLLAVLYKAATRKTPAAPSRKRL